MSQAAVLDPLSLAELAYEVAEVTGAGSELVRLLAEAAENAREDIAAQVWDAFLALPVEMRHHLACWFAQRYPGDGRTLSPQSRTGIPRAAFTIDRSLTTGAWPAPIAISLTPGPLHHPVGCPEPTPLAEERKGC